MKTIAKILTPALIFIAGTAISQQTTTWKGGTPGRTSQWDCPRNWEEGRVPDDVSNVFIPDVSSKSQCYPILAGKTCRINSLWMDSAAKLIISKSATLVILEDFFTPFEENLTVKGTLELLQQNGVPGKQPVAKTGIK